MEAFCYTPEEPATKSAEIGIVSAALKEGIVAHGCHYPHGKTGVRKGRHR
jgi:hypothetical protein